MTPGLTQSQNFCIHPGCPRDLIRLLRMSLENGKLAYTIAYCDNWVTLGSISEFGHRAQKWDP